MGLVGLEFLGKGERMLEKVLEIGKAVMGKYLEVVLLEMEKECWRT